jgi:hypothetical protein
MRSFFKLLKNDSATALPAVAAATHARLEIIGSAEAPPIVASVL